MSNKMKISITKVVPEMISMMELSHLIGVSMLTLLSWKDTGKLVPVQRDGVDMYHRDQIQCFSGMQLGF